MRFFAGKGGVGKTTCAAAGAVAEARAGHDVLIVSTDPAHSLGDALDIRLGPRPQSVPVGKGPVGRLRAVELDADRALARWLGTRRGALRTIALRGTYLDEADVDRFLELSLPGVDELIGLVELWRLARSGRPDLVVVDTAPTGHTLRLLQTPALLRQLATTLQDMQAKHRVLVDRLGGTAVADAAEALIEELEEDGRRLGEDLRDADRSRFSWVTLPEPLSIAEAQDGVGALRRAGLSVDELIVNQVTPRPPGRCPFCESRVREEAKALASLPRLFPRLRLRVVPAAEAEPRGPSALASLARPLQRAARPPARGAGSSARRAVVARSARAMGPAEPPWWLRALAPEATRLVLFAGKGGVGKTSTAAAVALAAASYTRRRVLLLSTDPAHSVGDVLRRPAGDQERRVALPRPALGALLTRELDAERALARERARYRQAVEELFEKLRRGTAIDPSLDRAVLEDLIEMAPPGIDELFALAAITGALLSDRTSAYDLVVIDTAPTGHTLRLLALPALALDWIRALMAVLLKYREVIGLGALSESLVRVSHELRALSDLLRRPARTSVVVVTRLAELPLRETVRLLVRLRELQLPVAALLANAVSTGSNAPVCPRCRVAARADGQRLRALGGSLQRLTVPEPPMILAPRVTPPPRGLVSLSEWGRSWTPWEPRA